MSSYNQMKGLLKETTSFMGKHGAHPISDFQTILAEVQDYYGPAKLHPDIIELRNIALVADLTVQCALSRKESRGIHYNLDYPQTLSTARDTIH